MSAEWVTAIGTIGTFVVIGAFRRELLMLTARGADVLKHRVVDVELACDWWYALQCKRFRRRHPLGTYPKGEEALPLPEPWPETAEYAKT